MRAIAIPFVNQPTPAEVPSARQRMRALARVILAAFDSFVPPHDPGRETEPPPEWYRFPPF